MAYLNEERGYVNALVGLDGQVFVAKAIVPATPPIPLVEYKDIFRVDEHCHPIEDECHHWVRVQLPPLERHTPNTCIFNSMLMSGYSIVENLEKRDVAIPDHFKRLKDIPASVDYGIMRVWRACRRTTVCTHEVEILGSKSRYSGDDIASCFIQCGLEIPDHFKVYEKIAQDIAAKVMAKNRKK